MIGKHVAITGGAGGIGRAIAEKCLSAGAVVSISDINTEQVNKIAKEIGATGYTCDVGSEASMEAFIKAANAKSGTIDLFVSNAGVGFSDEPGGHAAGGSNESWEASWQINVMASIYAGRSLIPLWLSRKTDNDYADDVNGRFVIVASAAGLLAQIGTASYTTTKHAALGYAEYMAIMHKADGIKVHCICPQYVRTAMTKELDVIEEGPDRHIFPSEVADTLFDCIEKDEFLVLPHPVIGDYFKAKASSHDRFIGGMSKLKEKIWAKQSVFNSKSD